MVATPFFFLFSMVSFISLVVPESQRDTQVPVITQENEQNRASARLYTSDLSASSVPLFTHPVTLHSSLLLYPSNALTCETGTIITTLLASVSY